MKLSRTDEPFDILGITFSTNLNEIVNLNYTKKINAIEAKIKQWQKRQISVLGRLTVLKTLLIPTLTHLFIAIPTPDTKTMKKLEGICFNYVWVGVDRISRNQMVQNTNSGGCGPGMWNDTS